MSLLQRWQTLACRNVHGATGSYSLCITPSSDGNLFNPPTYDPAAGARFLEDTIQGKPVEIEVLPVTLPTPRVWVHSWAHGPRSSTAVEAV